MVRLIFFVIVSFGRKYLLVLKKNTISIMIYFPLAINSSSEFDVDYSRVRISLNEKQMYSYSFQCVKVALSFQINKFHKTNILRNYLTYIMINAYNE